MTHVGTGTVAANTRRRALRLLVLAIALGASRGRGLAQSAAAHACESPVAKIVSVQGTVERRPAGQTEWQAVAPNQPVCAGDAIRVLARSRAEVLHRNQTALRLNANTTITVEEAQAEAAAPAVGLLQGAAHFLSRRPANLEVRTPFTVAGVRGTEFFMQVAEDGTQLSVFEGTVVAANEAGSLRITSGQSAVAEPGKAPALRTVVRPRDAVQWALYYPPVVYLRADELPAGSGWTPSVRRSLELHQKGDLQGALDGVRDVPPDARDGRLFAYRASLLLAVGAVPEARADIERALRLDPKNCDALALQGIIAVVQDEKTSALDVGGRAVEACPRSAAALISLSYAQQASSDLEGARRSLDQAVEAEPANALAWARLAELRSSFGELDEAQRAAQKAAELEPGLSRSQTVLGFAHLTRAETRQAREAFGKAIASDQADPLPRLGLGLTTIRDGRLDEGARELEVATSLDPNNSLLHSYLGKAYYEEKRGPLDENQYGVAKQLDPQDPTPWFYDAIAKQTTNRPVEALHDLQTAIELNDNRSVYRSRLLLDSDLAARSASLGRIYSDLGFQPRALVEGWKSVNVDPTNYSAHRFLADSYSVLPRHEIARVSELLQSQLLQPLNMTPIQPRLAEANLFQISAGGPTGPSFNEFNPLFNRDGVTLQTSGLVGSNDTYGGEGIVAGIYKQASFSVGGDHFSSDGFRPNNDQRDEIANAFVQGEISPETSIQGEYRYRNREQGDLQLRFFPDDFRPEERQTLETHTYRVGARHAFSPSSIVLGSFLYQYLDDTLRDRPPSPVVNSIDVAGKQHSAGGELQHLLRWRFIKVVSGAGYFDVGGDDTFITELDLDGAIVRDQQQLDRDLRHTNAYVYSYLDLLRNVTFTAGASADFVRGQSAVEDRDQFNPKAGITWTPLPGTTLRAAVFRALKRTLITQQTLEPTQVAGFNQFFDDGNTTESWRYGGGLDQALTETLFGGVEYSQRDLQVPFQFAAPPNPVVVREADWKERLARTYLLWAPHPWLALRLEYLYEHFDRDRDFTFGVADVDTHRVPLGVGFFHPSGLSASVTGTYFNQDGTFEPNPGEFRSGSDDFYIVDAGFSYRLPKRYGFVSVGATNLFDKQFRYQDMNFESPIVQPDRVFFARVTLAF
jgi:tetratricopeptide (TPR) repeat protein/opacity protein-like surface antigen